jgi:hypothetical protein
MATLKKTSMDSPVEIRTKYMPPEYKAGGKFLGQDAGFPDGGGA